MQITNNRWSCIKTKEQKRITQDKTSSYESTQPKKKRRKMKRRNLPRWTREDPGTNTRKMRNEWKGTSGREMVYKTLRRSSIGSQATDVRKRKNNCIHRAHSCTKWAWESKRYIREWWKEPDRPTTSQYKWKQSLY
jgi:hypothetical protein